MMSQYPSEDKARFKRQRTDQAIALATQNRWEEAVLINHSILELFPGDVEAYNRLGKALTALDRYSEARDAYQRALELDRGNIIAQRNLARLAQMPNVDAIPGDKREVADPRLFIEETGKTGFTELRSPATQEVLARMSPGDRVYLNVNSKRLEVENVRGEYLGQVEPRLALRLANLIKGGNRYAAAIASLDTNLVRVVIKETYQHPSQAGKVSFPSKSGDTFRPYIKETILRHELDEEETLDEEYGESEEGESYEEEPGFHVEEPVTERNGEFSI